MNISDLSSLARGIVRREAAHGGLERVVNLASRPSAYAGAVDVDVSYAELQPVLQAEAWAFLASLD